MTPAERPQQTRNAAGNMTMPVEIYDIGVCLDLLERYGGRATQDVADRLAWLLARPDDVPPCEDCGEHHRLYSECSALQDGSDE